MLNLIRVSIEHSLFRLSVVAYLSIIANVAWAIGDSSSGGCGTPALEAATISGEPKDLEAAIDKSIDGYVASYAASRKRSSSLFSGELRIIRPIPPREQLRKLFVNYWSGCGNELLIDIAAASGNIANAQYLLSIGAEPSGVRDQSGQFKVAAGADENVARQDKITNGTTVFMRCRSLTSDRRGVSSFLNHRRSSEDIERMIEVYDLLVASGGDVNAKTVKGHTAFHLCNDPEILKFLLKKGGDPDTDFPSDEQSYRGGKLSPLALRASQVGGNSRFLERGVVSKEDAQEICWILADELRARKQKSGLPRDKWDDRYRRLLLGKDEVLGQASANQPVQKAKTRSVTKDGKPRLHALGASSYCGRAEVYVQDTSAPLVLALSSGSNTEWRLVIAEGVQIREVILAASGPQTVRGLPQGVPVRLFTSEKSPCPDYECSQEKQSFHFNSEPNDHAWWLKGATGLDVSTYQHAYGGRYVIDGKRYTVPRTIDCIGSCDQVANDSASSKGSRKMGGRNFQGQPPIVAPQ